MVLYVVIKHGHSHPSTTSILKVYRQHFQTLASLILQLYIIPAIKKEATADKEIWNEKFIFYAD